MKNKTKARYKPASIKSLMKALNIVCYMISFNVVANVVMFGFISYQPERLGENIWIHSMGLLVLGGSLGMVFLLAWMLFYVITAIMGKPMVIIRKGKVLVLDNSNENSADIETMVTKF